MTQEEYIKNRLDDQIDWYDRKSSSNQRWFKHLRVAEIVLAAGIPLVLVFGGQEDFLIRITVAMQGVAVTIIAGVLSLYRFQENWVGYRSTCESLKHHKFLFETGVEPYTGSPDETFKRLVSNAETLISQENSNWTNLFLQKPEKTAARKSAGKQRA